jgi:hypothetical protein
MVLGYPHFRKPLTRRALDDLEMGRTLHLKNGENSYSEWLNGQSLFWGWCPMLPTYEWINQGPLGITGSTPLITRAGVSSCWSFLRAWNPCWLLTSTVPSSNYSTTQLSRSPELVFLLDFQLQNKKPSERVTKNYTPTKNNRKVMRGDIFQK